AATGAYVKLARRVGDAGVASVAVQVRWAADGTCASAAVAVGAAASVPLRASEAEAFLAGRTLDEATAAEAARLVQAAVTPFSDVRGSAEYRRDMVAVALTRALGIASRRHAGERVEAGYG
ncbi:MAG: xanthine dehydrogenase family protein subunit M, partial [Chloroflexi bacterium]|nr:xanthine dehydrogenase family protein subunit M [Chloroflexota bacterium]